VAIQYSNHKNYVSEDYTKVFFTEDNEIPYIIASTKDEKETLKDLFSRYFKVDYNWFEKQLFDFRLVNNNGNIIAETVYITHTPEVIDAEKNGSFLKFSQIHERQIELEPFYERAITGVGRSTFR
jgi:hypothetical protein